MRRRHAILATTAGAALVGGLVLAPQAMADEHEDEAPATPSLCIDLDISVQGTGEPFSICLPPEDGGEAPGLPGLPELPGLPTP